MGEGRVEEWNDGIMEDHSSCGFFSEIGNPIFKLELIKNHDQSEQRTGLQIRACNCWINLKNT
jgi:hypothetical protein